MKLYRTKYIAGEGETRYTWQGTQNDAAAKRKALKQEDRGGITTEDIDVPTDKPDLLAWLNENCAGE
jgi:hypothetical protein